MASDRFEEGSGRCLDACPGTRCHAPFIERMAELGMHIQTAPTARFTHGFPCLFCTRVTL